jgi:hypothetical protein
MATRHVVLTRSAYGPDWSFGANLARLKVTEGITAVTMARQTAPPDTWHWIILLDARDPLIERRMAVYQAAALSPGFIFWQPPEEAIAPAPWDPRADPGRLEGLAAAAYTAPWARAVGPRDEPLLQTRLDDDDGFAPDALERIARAGARLTERTILMLPIGYRTWRGQAERVVHLKNAWQTLFTPAGDELGVYDYGHTHAAEVAPVVMVDKDPGWLWVRHGQTISGTRTAAGTITPAIRAMFPIDWTLAR